MIAELQTERLRRLHMIVFTLVGAGYPEIDVPVDTLEGFAEGFACLDAKTREAKETIWGEQYRQLRENDRKVVVEVIERFEQMPPGK